MVPSVGHASAAAAAAASSLRRLSRGCVPARGCGRGRRDNDGRWPQRVELGQRLCVHLHARRSAFARQTSQREEPPPSGRRWRPKRGGSRSLPAVARRAAARRLFSQQRDGCGLGTHATHVFSPSLARRMPNDNTVLTRASPGGASSVGVGGPAGAAAAATSGSAPSGSGCGTR